MSRLFFGLLLLWLALYSGAFWVWGQILPEGDGFTRGLNRAGPFYALQMVALLVGLGALLIAIRNRPRTPWWGYLLGLLPLIVLIGTIIWRVVEVTTGAV